MKCLGKRTKFKRNNIKKRGGNNNLLKKLYDCGCNAKYNCTNCDNPLCNACNTNNRCACQIDWKSYREKVLS